MRYYYRIANGQAMDLYEVDGDIEGLYHPDVKFVEVTGLDPMPEFGWIYDEATNTLSAPPPPYIDPRPPILAELAQIDRDSARPLRTLIISNPDLGEGTPERAELELLEQRAIELRAELDALPPQP